MPPTQKSPIIYVIAIFAILVIVGMAFLILINRNSGTGTGTVNTGQDQSDSGFTPFGRIPAPVTPNTANIQATSTEPGYDTPSTPSTLRLLSNTPVGGYGASTTASTTIVRWVDRGRGNIYEAHGDILDVITISNTVVPKIYDSLWNKNLTAFIGPSLQDGVSEASLLYAELRARPVPKTASSTGTNAATTTALTAQLMASTSPGSSFIAQTPYELKGKNLPQHIVAYAISPKKDKIFFLVNDKGSGIGYTATFDGKSVTQIFNTPITQVNAEWPEENTIAITTKGSAFYGGFLYFVNPKTGIWKKILGPIIGLSTRVSHDGKSVLASSAEGNTMSTAIFNVSSHKFTSAVFRTLADKCVWGNFNLNMVYCAVPAQPVNGLYPDDWYRGLVSGADKIWQLNSTTGEIHLVSSIVDQSDRVIDAFNLGLDPKDEYLLFMNKNDLSLWSLDLVAGQII